jgi:hypothetical protein
MDQTAMLARKFEQESNRIDGLIWSAMALRSGESALFCGLANNITWIKRAVAAGVDVTVITNDVEGSRDLRALAVRVMRGSTTLLPARDASFDATIAFHYLHEIDPFFHPNVVAELGRVGKRCIIVEPAPPSDPLGRRIASLYSRAKRELGQFENYQDIDYWRKLLTIVKPDVAYDTFAFMCAPPPEAMRETVALIIDTMAAEETPEPYMRELRALAKLPDAQLVPQARYVVVGAAAPARVDRHAVTSQVDWRSIALPEPPAVYAGAARDYAPPDTEPEFPDVSAPRAPVEAARPRPRPAPAPPAAPAPAPPPAVSPTQVARNAFGLPAGESKARRGVVPTVSSEDDDFGSPDDPADAAAEFGWEWETPVEP